MSTALKDPRLLAAHALAGAAFEAGDHALALHHATSGLAVQAWPPLLEQAVCCLMRLGRHDAALALAQSQPEAERSPNMNDALAELYDALGHAAASRRHGSLALRQKDAETPFLPPLALPPLARSGAAANIVSFTLYGADPRYCETAILNCHAIARLLPGWTPRFYIDDSVPAAVLARIEQAGGTVRAIDKVGAGRLDPRLWRFLVADDPSVARYLVRDADSLIGRREVAAVQAWLASGRWFHVMRDAATHTEPMLAGLWGAAGGLDFAMEHLCGRFLQHGRYTQSHLDQHFLRACIWPTARQSVLQHDERFDLPGAEPFPQSRWKPLWPDDHVGANFAFAAISGCAPAGCSDIEWALVDDFGAERCRYRAGVRDGRWQASLPFTLARLVAERHWSVRAPA